MIFALTTGPADLASSTPKPMTVGFEYVLPGPRSPRDWAQSWHKLGATKGFDSDYLAALQAVTDSFTGPTVNGGKSALSQVRTNESALDWIWQTREFKTSPVDGHLHLSAVQNTPNQSFNGTAALGDLLRSNSSKVLAKQLVVPESMLSGSSYNILFSWQVSGVDEPVRKAFARETCNGCHGSENPTIDTAFHMSPFRSGVAKLSTFLNAPGTSDELSEREQSLREGLCAP
jgi:hypothetical protein